MAKGRPVTPLGTWGEINVSEISPGTWQAEARIRLESGKRKRVRARGASKSAATRAIKAKLSNMGTTTDSDLLTSTSTLTALLDQWIDRHDVSGRTKTIYKQCIRLHIKPALGDVCLNEITTPRLQLFLDGLSDATAHTARAVLGSAVSLAVRWGIMSHNAVRDTALRKKQRQEVRALTDAEISAYRTRLVKWCGGNSMGPARGEGLVEIIDVCIGSGCRIGEVLALRWEDVDLDGGFVTVTGTIDDDAGDRKDLPKTEGSRRTVKVTPDAVAALRRQWDKPYRPFLGMPVFPTRSGGYRTVSNTETRLRKARDNQDDITPHDFRKTVATRIEQQFGMLAASRHLGHSSTSVTEQAYLARPEVLPDYTAALVVKPLRAV